MELAEFEKKLNDIRARNGWTIDIECCGVFIITICDKETGKGLYRTGSTSLESIVSFTDKKSLKSELWEKLK